MTEKRVEQGVITKIPTMAAYGYADGNYQSELSEFLQDFRNVYTAKTKQTRKQGKRK